jgi:hypothetical protein
MNRGNKGGNNEGASMSKLPWTPWHKVVQLRDDIRSGELSMAIFAADLHDVVIPLGRRLN